MVDSTDIAEDELLYRKVSVNSGWYDPERSELKPDALKPRRDDDNGISLDRAQSVTHPEFRCIEEAAQGSSPNGYYVAVFQVGTLRSHGFTVTANAVPDNSGHALIEDLTYDNRKDPSSQGKMALLAHQLVERVEGPFRSGSE